MSCQNFEKGWHTAYRHLAEEDLDVVLHLGDHIYENPPRRGLPRRHVGGEPADLPGYRVCHALYKTDRDLQAPTRATRSSPPGTTTRSRTTTPAGT